MRNVTPPTKTLEVIPKHERVFLDEWTNDDISELQLGLIRSALDDIQDKRKSKTMQREAKEWLLRNDDESPFAFLVCCQCLGLNPYLLLNMVDTLLEGGLYE
ncbi:hypothetical protein QUN99_003443 [Vibrio parahaemolyticus]|nr:hypothetical protein [Vibrio parahaemolyticus]